MASKEFDINGKIYTSLQLIGKGATGKVYSCLVEDDNSVVAVKCIDLEGRDDKYKQNIFTELQILKKLQKSGRVIHYIDSAQKDDNLYIVMEKGDTDLANYFKTEKIDRIKRQFYWQEMLAAVKTLHDNKIIHKDLKPQNFILVQGSLKLIDFGLARNISEDRSDMYLSNCGAGTIDYISPEAVGASSKNRPTVSVSCDVWSLGCMLYFMTYGKTPFADVDGFHKLAAITDPKIPIKIPMNDPKDVLVFDVIKKCLQREPSSRPTIDELLNHGYLKPTDPMADLKQVFKALGVSGSEGEATSSSKTTSDVRLGVKERTTTGPRRTVGFPMIIDLDRSSAGSGTMVVACISPSKLEPTSFCAMENKGGGMVELTITPKEAGIHSLHIEFNDKEIKGSPWRFRIEEPDNNMGIQKRN